VSEPRCINCHAPLGTADFIYCRSCQPVVEQLVPEKEIADLRRQLAKAQYNYEAAKAEAECERMACIRTIDTLNVDRDRLKQQFVRLHKKFAEAQAERDAEKAKRVQAEAAYAAMREALWQAVHCLKGLGDTAKEYGSSFLVHWRKDGVAWMILRDVAPILAKPNPGQPLLDRLAKQDVKLKELTALAIASSDEGTNFYYKDAWEADRAELARLRETLTSLAIRSESCCVCAELRDTEAAAKAEEEKRCTTS
jgi:hypothetical protein